jgi:uncharacterized coiled-coil protein SlyX
MHDAIQKAIKMLQDALSAKQEQQIELTQDAIDVLEEALSDVEGSGQDDTTP